MLDSNIWIPKSEIFFYGLSNDLAKRYDKKLWSTFDQSSKEWKDKVILKNSMQTKHYALLACTEIGWCVS